MAFDIHQQVFASDGTPLEKQAGRYQEQLLQLFEQSPEWQVLQNEGIEAGWASVVMDFGVNYLGVTPPQMSPADLGEILFDLFPSKLSASSDEAPHIIRELRAFWQFLQREFQVGNATACLRVLDDKAVHTLQQEMSNPAHFGIAKSFLMKGIERGFDMSSQEDVNAWMLRYNAELLAGTGQPISFPGEQSGRMPQIPNRAKPGAARSKRKKQQKKKK